MKLLGDKVLLKKYTVSTKDEDTGMEWGSDKDTLPRAEVILVSEDVKDFVSVGDHVYYVEPREKGKCKYNDEEHFITPLSSLVAIL